MLYGLPIPPPLPADVICEQPLLVVKIWILGMGSFIIYFVCAIMLLSLGIFHFQACIHLCIHLCNLNFCFVRFVSPICLIVSFLWRFFFWRSGAPPPDHKDVNNGIDDNRNYCGNNYEDDDDDNEDGDDHGMVTMASMMMRMVMMMIMKMVMTKVWWRWWVWWWGWW